MNAWDYLTMWIADYLERQRAWTLRTFGGGRRTDGICAHIAKELDEIRARPNDRREWIDVIILAFEGYMRHGGTAWTLVGDLESKQRVNFERQWPSEVPHDQPTEHIKS